MTRHGPPIRQAIANSAAVIIATAGIGAIVKNYAYMTDSDVTQSGSPLVLALALIPSAIIGSLIGSRMTHRLPVQAIRIAFVGLMLVAAIRLSKGALADISDTGVATCSFCAMGRVAMAGTYPTLETV